MTYDILAWDRHKNMAGLNQVMGSPNPPSLDDWVSKGNAINKKKTAQIRFHSKRLHIYYHKMNDNINLDSTIAGSMNDCS